MNPAKPPIETSDVVRPAAAAAFLASAIGAPRYHHVSTATPSAVLASSHRQPNGPVKVRCTNGIRSDDATSRSVAELHCPNVISRTVAGAADCAGLSEPPHDAALTSALETKTSTAALGLTAITSWTPTSVDNKNRSTCPSFRPCHHNPGEQRILQATSKYGGRIGRSSAVTARTARARA